MQNGNGNIKLAVQKDGRLTENSLQLLRNCNLDIEKFSDKLVVSVRNFKLDLLFLRDDDIPEYVQDGVAELGIVGEDVIKETKSDVKIVKKLGFGKCNLRIAIPENIELKNLSSLNHKRIATSFPNILTDYLLQNKIDAKVVHISGSVEAAPSLGIADYICDLVSTGNTLKLNKLKASINVLESELFEEIGLTTNKDALTHIENIKIYSLYFEKFYSKSILVSPIYKVDINRPDRITYMLNEKINKGETEITEPKWASALEVLSPEYHETFQHSVFYIGRQLQEDHLLLFLLSNLT